MTDPLGMPWSWWVFLVTCIAWLSWDLYAEKKWGNPGTLSVVLNAWFKTKALPIVLAIGFILGHIIWQVHICDTPCPSSPPPPKVVIPVPVQSPAPGGTNALPKRTGS